MNALPRLSVLLSCAAFAVALSCDASVADSEAQSRVLVETVVADWDGSVEIAVFEQPSSASDVLIANRLATAIYVTDSLGTLVAIVKPRSSVNVPVASCAASGAIALSNRLQSIPHYVDCRAGRFYALRASDRQGA